MEKTDFGNGLKGFNEAFDPNKATGNKSASVVGSGARCDEPGHVLIRMPDGSDYGMHALEAFNLAYDIKEAAIIARRRLEE